MYELMYWRLNWLFKQVNDLARPDGCLDEK